MRSKEGIQNRDIDLINSILDTCWSGIIVADKEGNYLFTNEQYEKVTGWSGDIIKLLSTRVMKQNLIREKFSVVDLVLRYKKEIEVLQSNYEGKTWLVRGIPYLDDAGEIQYVICYLLDMVAIRSRGAEGDGAQGINPQSGTESTDADVLPESDRSSADDPRIVYQSAVMRDVLSSVDRIAATDAIVLIRGESGVGKELFARRIHEESGRKGKPMIRINCGAIPESLFESEFFGYEPGSFTGGSGKGKKGLLEYARGGTVFLDEIGTMPFSMQSKLLRVLQDRAFRRIGGHEEIATDVRFVAATNADMERMIRENNFRADLFYRLNVIGITIPPLRERREDIPLLLSYFMEELNQKYHTRKAVTPTAISKLMAYDFPGNVRQLQSLIEQVYLLTPGKRLTGREFDRYYGSYSSVSPTRAVPVIRVSSEKKTLPEMMDEYEKQILSEYKEKFKSSHKVAEQLGMNQSTISRKFHKYGIEE